MHLYNYNNLFNLSKETFCSSAVQFQIQKTASPLYIYILFFVENEQNMVVFSILIQYFRYFSPSFILGLSPIHLHLYKKYFKIKIT